MLHIWINKEESIAYAEWQIASQTDDHNQSLTTNITFNHIVPKAAKAEKKSAPKKAAAGEKKKVAAPKKKAATAEKKKTTAPKKKAATTEKKKVIKSFDNFSVLTETNNWICYPLIYSGRPEKD